MKQVLTGRQAVKMLGLTDILTELVQNLRVTELKLSTKFRKLLCLRIFLGESDVGRNASLLSSCGLCILHYSNAVEQ